MNVYKDIDEMEESDLNFCLKSLQNGGRNPPQSLCYLFAMLNYTSKLILVENIPSIQVLISNKQANVWTQQ